MPNNWFGSRSPLEQRERDRYWLVLTPRRPDGPGSFRVSLGEKRPMLLHRAMLRLLLGWRVAE